MGLDTTCGNIRERDIILLGEQQEVARFIERYHESLKIKMVMTEHSKEVKTQPYADLQVTTVLFTNVTSAGELIVICDRNGFETRKKLLRHLGKKEYKDFISQEIVEALVYQKSLMVCMGTHLIEQVTMFLGCSKDVMNDYSIVFFRESDIYAPYRNRLQEYVHVCRWCDVYVRSACEKERFSLKILGENTLPPNCKVITVADYGFGGYFPQIIRDRDRISDFLLRERERLELSYETLAFSRVDKELEALCKAKIDIEVIVAKLLDSDFYSAQSVQKHYAAEVKRFKELEINDDIKLGDFLEAHCEECVCRNLDEWNEPVVSYVTENILQKLGLPKLSMEKQRRRDLIEKNSGSEILIYPSVQKGLGLEDKLRNKKYQVTTYYNQKYMSGEEYIRYMAEYISKALAVMQFMGIEQEMKSRLFAE